MKGSLKMMPREFFWRRVHSIFGLLIVLFLIEHMLTNSQAALLFGESGQGFIDAVNFIKHLPYLPFLEIFLIGTPIVFHGVLGVKYALSGKFNSFPTDGSHPSLTRYPRNHAYTLQRLTSWILLIGIIAHVSYMRFYRYPTHARISDKVLYFNRLTVDEGLYTVSARLGVKLFDEKQIEEEKRILLSTESSIASIEDKAEFLLERKKAETTYSFDDEKILLQWQNYKQQQAFVKALTHWPLSDKEVVAQAPDFGVITLLMVRDAFKSVFKSILYTIFVLSAAFHGFNGLWTFCMTWGVMIKARTQSRVMNFCWGLMGLIAFLGLASIWGSYFVNLAK